MHLVSRMRSSHAEERPAKKARKARGRGLRTRTGCVVCRVRHVKCDETKPVCSPCTKSNRNCAWNINDTQSVSESGNIEQRNEDAVSADSDRRLSDSLTTGPESVDQTIPQSYESSLRYETAQLTDSTPASSPTRTAVEDTTSPQSAISSQAPVEVATARWFGLLANDAVDFNVPDVGEQSPSLERTSVSTGPTMRYEGFNRPSISVGTRAATPSGPDEAEELYWHRRQLPMADEIPLFDHFVEHLSSWLDLFDPLKHFSTTVPHLALNNEGLFKAILALSSRHLSLVNNTYTADRTAAVQYYSDTLRYLQGAMRYHTFTRSLELLSTTLILSQYEMIDGAGGGWERHLKGVFWIQRSQNTNGQSGGLKQAVWWSWLRQDVWAAYKERRRCLSFYEPTRPYADLDQFDLANRAIYLLAQCVNYASDEETKLGEGNLQLRLDRARQLCHMLDSWSSNLTHHFNPLPVAQDVCKDSHFRPIKVHPAALAAALQVHHFARILLLIHQPAAGGHSEYKGRQRRLHVSIDAIGGLALMIKDQAAEVISTQCLYAAGLYTDDEMKRQEICALIERHQARAGWPIESLTMELERAEESQDEDNPEAVLSSGGVVPTLLTV